MMEPPPHSSRSARKLSHRPSHPSFASTSFSSVSASPSTRKITSGHGPRQTEVSSLLENPDGFSPYTSLGQFSYAPATKTTVVTTTTTTTTSLPPLIMRPPCHLKDLDPKLYPLAATPTPQAIKKFGFEISGTPISYEEAEDTRETIQKFKQQQNILRASNGIIQSVVQHEPHFETPQSVHSNRLTVENSFVMGESSKDPFEKFASPVSISEAVERAKLRRGGHKRPRTSGKNIPGRGTSLNVARASPHLRHHTFREATPATPDTDGSTTNWNESSRRITRRRTSQHPVQPSQQSPTSPSEVDEQDAQPVLTTSNPGATSSSAANEELDVDMEENIIVQDSTDLPEATAATATPPMAEADLQPASTTSAPSRLPPLDTTIAQDPSLPSPSLSPVTAARNRSANAGYLQSEEDDDEDIGSDFDLDDSRDANSTRLASNQRSKFRDTSFAHQQLPTPGLMDVPQMLDFFDAMPAEMKTYMMYQFLRRCPKPTLHFVNEVVNPALKCDFLGLLPLELSLNVVRYLDVQSLCRAAQVSKKWRTIINSDERAWKELFDRDGYELAKDELRRAIEEGWGWLQPQAADDWERDVSAGAKSDSESSTTSRAGDRALVAELSFSQSLASGRPKRKATTRYSSRVKQQKRNQSAKEDSESTDRLRWFDQLSAAEGPYAAANAAALAVPHPKLQLPSLKNLHLWKSIYRRHHLIRMSWMQEDVKPMHLAFRAHQRHVVTCLQFDADKILTGSDDTNINVYDTKTGALRTKLEGHEGGVWALQYEGNTLVSGSTDRSVRVWDIEKGVCTHVFQGHTSTVRCLQILMPTEVGQTADGKPIYEPKYPLIITGSRDSNLRIWRLPKPDDQRVFQTSPPVNETDCPYFVRVLTGHHHSVRAIAAHADTLVSGSYDCTVRVWKISTGESVHRLQSHTQKVYSVVLDHNRNRCISGSMDNLVKVWSLDTGTVLFNLEGHTSLVGLLDLSFDRLVSAAADSTLRIWDPENGQCKNTLSAHTGAITCFQHDSQKVISGSDRTLKMWNIKNGECVKDLLTDLSGVWQVKFDERRCVAAVQRNNLTYIEVLDFGAIRDGVPDVKRGRRIVVNTRGQEVDDPLDETDNDATGAI